MGGRILVESCSYATGQAYETIYLRLGRPSLIVLGYALRYPTASEPPTSTMGISLYVRAKVVVAKISYK